MADPGRHPRQADRVRLQEEQVGLRLEGRDADDRGRLVRRRPDRRLLLDDGGQDDGAGDVPEEERHGVVGLRREGSPVHRHEEGDAGELEAERLGRRDASDGGEDDVRPTAKDAGQAHVRRDEEAGHDEAVHGRAPGDGLLPVQVQLSLGRVEPSERYVARSINQRETCRRIYFTSTKGS